jgi:hypothetical protein
MTLRVTHTRTYNTLDPWAQTTPHDHPAVGCRAVHVHAGDPCAVPDCGEPIPAGEVCYAVVELPRVGRGERWVCWRHVHPDQGPLRT